MFQFVKKGKYKSLIGNTKESIEAIQRYLDSHSSSKKIQVENTDEPASSINRIIQSTACEETNSEIQKIIDNL